MPWVVREAVRDINRAVGRRWHGLDPLLPDPATLPAGCGEPLVVTAGNGRLAGLGVCVHQHIPAQALNQTWGAADRFTLVPRLAGQDVAESADLLLAQWRDHLAGVGAARGPDTSASVVWPSLDITGIQGLQRHGLQPVTVIAARTRPGGGVPPARPRAAFGVTIRDAGPGDEDQVLDLELRLIRYDMHFGGPVWRPDTARLVRDEIRASLARPATWTWLAERNSRAVGLLVAQPPQEAGWITGMTSRSPPPTCRRCSSTGRSGAPGSARPWSGTCTPGWTALAWPSPCCTTARSTRCRRRSGTGWATGRCGPAGKPGRPARCGKLPRSA